MPRKFEKGGLCLARKIWWLRNDKWGTASKRRALN
jgi:hypothetical protein